MPSGACGWMLVVTVIGMAVSLDASDAVGHILQARGSRGSGYCQLCCEKAQSSKASASAKRSSALSTTA